MTFFARTGIALLSLSAALSHAEEAKTLGWKHESEVSIARAEGNARTETYSGKQTTAHQFEAALGRLSGHYLYGTARDIENARNWDVSARYEKDLYASFGAYLTHAWESDKFIGFRLRSLTGAGGKYFFYEGDRTTKYAFAEFGYTYANEKRTPGAAIARLESHFLRGYVETRLPITETTSGKVAVEVLHDLAHSNNFQSNFEGSLAVSMTKILALNTSYVGRYRQTPVVAGNKRFDSLFSVGLLAKF